ncbi:MAG: hypothetical protein AB2L09_11360 [Coriobacteriia bacterium]
MAERKQVLITVKTYPNLSDKYDETVCTAGIDLDTGKLMRLYPVRYRHLPFEAQFKKWDVLELEVEHRGKDGRGDTWTPLGENYKFIRHMGTGRGKPPDWAERKNLIKPLASTIEELRVAAAAKECSLGVVRVHGPAALRAIPDTGEWMPEQTAILNRNQLFGPKLRALERIPWKFIYDFKCAADCTGHSFQVFDWEPYALYRGQRNRGKNPEAAARDVEHQYSVRLGIETRDVHLFVGTHYLRQEQFTGIGVFYPPK